ncbi:unnamed protein product [Notodromas monacha]|uniref:Major facilitator superfamily (MFS) profile domain-containing protein n=1 Tax=Notodromas monacha TaxID=399045 RepID=A0A7R9BVP0_9CRUS|nr:unnamed protein product [Notodromas monacha]CAG0922243.1 unnamed protein product [Notodromas monacha]
MAEIDGKKVDELDGGLQHPSHHRIRGTSLSTTEVDPHGSSLKVFKQWSTRQKIVVCALALLDFCGFACLSVMGPFFPTEATAKGVSAHVVGLIFSCYAFTTFATSPLWGRVVPRCGPKAVIMIGGLLTGSACCAFGFLDLIPDTVGFTVACFTVRMVEALGFAAFNTALFTIVASMFLETMGSALLEILIGSGLAIGPAIGSGLYMAGGYPAPFAFLGALLLCIVGVLYVTLPSVQPVLEDDSSVAETYSTVKVLKSFSATLICMTVLGNALGIAYLIPILSLHLGTLGVAEEKAGYMFLCHLGMYALVAPISGHFSDKYPKKRFAIIGSGLLLFTAGTLIIGPSPFLLGILPQNLGTTIVGLLVIGMGSAFALVPTFQSLITCMIDMIGPSLAATTMEYLGFPWSTTICSCILLVIGLLCVYRHNVDRPERSRRFLQPRTNSTNETAPLLH